MVDSVHVNTPGVGSASQEVRLVSVERDVAALKEGLSTLTTSVSSGFDKITAKLEHRTSPNYTLVGIVLGAVMTISGWGFTLFGSFQSRTESTIAELKTSDREINARAEATNAKFYPREDLIERLNTLKERRDDQQRMTDGRLSRIEGDLDSFEKTSMPHGELTSRFAAQAAVNDGLQRQIDRMNDQIDRTRRGAAQ